MLLTKVAEIELEDMPINDMENEDDKTDADSDSEVDGFDEQDQNQDDNVAPLHVLPLYSLLPSIEQSRIFQEPPEGSRLCVVATNVAETSLTIPGVRYVVDCGRAKERYIDKETGVQKYRIGWISKASAEQRAGRSGRTGPGHVYRLYSSAVFDRDFSDFAQPQILNVDIEGIVLQMKAMNIDTVINFPFPTPPDIADLTRAEKLLRRLGALNTNGAITTLGRNMAQLPLSPRYAKMLLIGQQHGAFPYILAVVAGLTVGNPFVTLTELKDLDEDDHDPMRRKDFFTATHQFGQLEPGSDVLKLLSAICAYSYEPEASRQQFCASKFLRYKAMDETNQLRIQITKILNQNYNDSVSSVGQTLKLDPPSTTQISAIKQIVAAGYIDQIAVRADLLDTAEEILKLTYHHRKNPQIWQLPYVTLFPSNTANDDPFVYIHSSSALASQGHAPDYLIYESLNKTTANRIRMMPLTPIRKSLIEALARGTSLLTYSKPLNNPAPPRVFTDEGRVKREAWSIPRLVPDLGAGQASKGWDLPIAKRIEIIR